MTIKQVTDPNEAYAIFMVLGDQRKTRQIDAGEDINVEKASLLLAHEIETNPRFRLFAAFDETSAARGYISGYVHVDLHTGSLYGSEYLWIVADAFLKTGVGLQLLETWEKHCAEQGCKKILCGLTPFGDGAETADRLRRCYTKRGYHLRTEVWAKSI